MKTTRTFARLFSAATLFFVTGGCSLLDWDSLTGTPPPSSGDAAVRIEAGANEEASAAADAYADAVRADNPEAYLRFEEEPGSSTARDETGRHSATYSSSLSRDSGVVGNGIVVSSSATMLLAGAIDLSDNHPFSFELWAAVGTARSSISLGIGNAAGSAFLLVGNLNLEQPGTFVVRDCCSSYDHTGGSSIPLDEFIHVVGTYDGALLRHYVNGALAGELPSPKRLVATTWAPNLSIQGRARVDEIAIYRQALPSERILAHCQAAKRCR